MHTIKQHKKFTIFLKTADK